MFSGENKGSLSPRRVRPMLPQQPHGGDVARAGGEHESGIVVSRRRLGVGPGDQQTLRARHIAGVEQLIVEGTQGQRLRRVAGAIELEDSSVVSHK